MGDNLDMVKLDNLHGIVLRDGSTISILGASPDISDIHDVGKLYFPE